MSETYLTFEAEDGSSLCWPNPYDPVGVEWKLRYEPESVTGAEMMLAASMVRAYRHMVSIDSHVRDLRVTQLRKAAKPSEESL